MIRKQIYLSEEMNRKLQELASDKGVPQSEVIREGLEQYLVQQENQEDLWDGLLDEMKNSPYRKLEWNRETLYRSRIGEKRDESDD